MVSLRVERGVFSSHLACVNPECPKYSQVGHGNLVIRKTYGRDHIRYLRCRTCQREFSERKNTPLWNSKITESKAVAVAEHLAEGNSLKATARLTRVCPETVRRLSNRLGMHAEQFHDQHVHRLSSTSLQADERWGFAGCKQYQLWQAEVIDPATRLVVSFATGERNEQLIEQLLRGAAARLSFPQGVVLFTDGEPSYEKLFRRVFGRAYRPARNGSRGRFPKLRYRLKPYAFSTVQPGNRRSNPGISNDSCADANESQAKKEILGIVLATTTTATTVAASPAARARRGVPARPASAGCAFPGRRAQIRTLR